MSEIINLRRVRKRLARQKDAEAARENRFLYGRSKGEKQAQTLIRLQRSTLLDGAILDEVTKNASSEGTDP